MLRTNGVTVAEFVDAKIFYEVELKRRATKLQYRRVIKLAKILKKYKNVTLICNKNLRYDRAKARKAIKIGQTNDKLRGYPEYIVWALIGR